MSLYRLYRPQSFADVAGQSPVVDTLIQAVQQDKLAHAYLFAGIRGTGKTSIARILAKELLTRGISDDTIREQIIRGVEDGSLVDLIEIDAASNRGIDDIRSLLEKIQFTPVVAAAKVYIIDEVHMLTREAFNALLKTLEEPPAYAYFILATTELHKIPATIQSRCQRFLFRQIREEDIVARLRFIAEKESITIDDAALFAIAHHGGGSMRDSISLLDQLRSLQKSIGIADVKERIGESGHEYVEQLFTAIENSDRETIISLVRAMEEAAVPLENATRLLLEDIRTRLHQAVSAKQDTTRFVRMLDTLMNAIKALRIAPVPGLVLESALLSLTTEIRSTKSEIRMNDEKAKNEKPFDSAQDKPETKNDQPVAPNPIPQSQSEPQAEPEPEPQSHPSSLNLPSLRTAWPQILEKVEPAFVRMSLKNGRIHTLDNNTITLAFGSSFHRDKASALEGGQSLQDAIKAITGQHLRMQYVLDTDIQGTPDIPAAEAVNLVEAAADIF